MYVCMYTCMFTCMYVHAYYIYMHICMNYGDSLSLSLSVLLDLIKSYLHMPVSLHQETNSMHITIMEIHSLVYHQTSLFLVETRLSLHTARVLTISHHFTRYLPTWSSLVFHRMKVFMV